MSPHLENFTRMLEVAQCAGYKIERCGTHPSKMSAGDGFRQVQSRVVQ